MYGHFVEAQRSFRRSFQTIPTTSLFPVARSSTALLARGSHGVIHSDDLSLAKMSVESI
jgi:hypothetical protein